MKAKKYEAICRFLDISVAMPTSEAICETWGSVIEAMTEHQLRANDGSVEEGKYGTIEDRIMVRLNGPPPGYKNNDKILIHALQDCKGLNYISNFYTKSSPFNVISIVQNHIQRALLILPEIGQLGE